MTLPAADYVIVIGDDGLVVAAGDPKLQDNDALTQFLERHRVGGLPAEDGANGMHHDGGGIKQGNVPPKDLTSRTQSFNCFYHIIRFQNQRAAPQSLNMHVD